MNQYGQHGELKQYHVVGMLIGHDGFQANLINDTAEPQNPQTIQVDEYVYTNQGESGAISAAAHKVRQKTRRIDYYWMFHPAVSQVAKETEKPEDQRLRAQNAATLPGLEG